MGLIKRKSSHRESERRGLVRDREGLLAQLDGPVDSERRRAARDLVEHHDVSDALCRRLDMETEPSVRAVLFSSLTLIADQRAIVGLLTLLRSEDAGLRNGAIEALKCLPDQIEAYIDVLLLDDDPDVRIFTVNILEALPHPRVPSWLCGVIESETEVNVCAAAIDLLTDLGTPDMVSALMTVRVRFADTPYIAFAVDLAVQRIGDATAVQFPV